MTSKSKTSPNKFPIIVLVGILVMLFAFYIFLSIYTATSQQSIELAKKRLRDAQGVNNTLKVQLADASSLEYILEKSSEIAYVEIENASYFTKSSKTPLAQR